MPKRPLRSPVGSPSTEWLGTTFSLPGYVTGEGEPYRPEVILWVAGVGGPIVGVHVVRPDEMRDQVGSTLAAAIRAPSMPVPPPQRVRVPSEDLARRLRLAVPGVEIVCAPTPELAPLQADLREHLSRAPADPTQRAGISLVPPREMASLCRAAAEHYRARPWAHLPSPTLLVSIPDLGVERGVVSVMGALGETYGFVFFASVEDHGRFEANAPAARRGHPGAGIPQHIALVFETRARLSLEWRDEIAREGWSVAGPAAFPWPVHVDPDLVTRLVSSAELIVLEAIARAITHAVEDGVARSTTVARAEVTVNVQTHAGALAVLLSPLLPPGPAGGLERQEETVDEVLAAKLEAIDNRPSSAFPAGLVYQLYDLLLDRFLSAPEGHRLRDTRALELIFGLAAEHLGITVATLSRFDLATLLFEIMPRVPARGRPTASETMMQLRSFFAYGERELHLPRARELLHSLDAIAERKLEDALTPRPRAKGKKRAGVKDTGRVYELKVTLCDIRPPIWRRVRVDGRTTLGQLHGVLQAAFGWTNSHLHEFRTRGTGRRGRGSEELEEGARLEELAEKGTKLLYVYDFGDDWYHEILVTRVDDEAVLAGLPSCVAGGRAGPPEDCGGPSGYEELIAVLADEEHAEHAHLRSWVGRTWQPEAFDLKAIARRLQRR